MIFLFLKQKNRGKKVVVDMKHRNRKEQVTRVIAVFPAIVKRMFANIQSIKHVVRMK